VEAKSRRVTGKVGRVGKKKKRRKLGRERICDEQKER
jgi:hypothetical protein